MFSPKALVKGNPASAKFSAENTSWNTRKHTLSKHAQQKRCEPSGKYLGKLIKELNHVFGVQNDPKIGPLSLRPIFNTPLKVSQIDMLTKTDAKPVENFWENDQRQEFLLPLGPLMAPKLGLWGPNSTHHWKYLQWACEAILIMWNQC